MSPTVSISFNSRRLLDGSTGYYSYGALNNEVKTIKKPASRRKRIKAKRNLRQRMMRKWLIKAKYNGQLLLLKALRLRLHYRTLSPTFVGDTYSVPGDKCL